MKLGNLGQLAQFLERLVEVVGLHVLQDVSAEYQVARRRVRRVLWHARIVVVPRDPPVLEVIAHEFAELGVTTAVVQDGADLRTHAQVRNQRLTDALRASAAPRRLLRVLLQQLLLVVFAVAHRSPPR